MPMTSIIRTFADKGDKRPLLLLYGSRTYDEITFREELEELAGRPQLKVAHVLRSPHEGWSGECGYVDVEIFRRQCAAAQCGARIFHLWARRDDGRDRAGAWRTRGADVTLPFRALQLRLGGNAMCRVFADRLVLAIAIIVIGTALIFPWYRVCRLSAA